MPRSSVYRAASLGEFPKPIKLGEKASGWLESDVDAWIDSRVAASRAQ
jgi:prophage regulatory protein